MNTKIFNSKMMFVLLTALLLSAACGTAAEEDVGFCAIESMHRIPAEVGSIFTFPDSASGPNILSVNQAEEGLELRLSSASQGLYSQSLDLGYADLFGETGNEGAIIIRAYDCDEYISFTLDIQEARTVQEMMIFRDDPWNGLSQIIKGSNPQVNPAYTGVHVGVINEHTHEIMGVVGLNLPNRENWAMPYRQLSMEGFLTSFYLPNVELGSAISSINFLPQPGWKELSPWEFTAENGDQFIIFRLVPEIPVVDLRPADYPHVGQTVRLVVQADLLSSQEDVMLTGIRQIHTGEEFLLQYPTNSFIVEIPFGFHDVSGVTAFLGDFDAITEKDYDWAINLEYGFHYMFDIVEGTLDYFFEVEGG